MGEKKKKMKHKSWKLEINDGGKLLKEKNEGKWEKSVNGNETIACKMPTATTI